MAHILVHHRVNDFETWKPIFDEHATFRAENGSGGGRVFRSSNDPNEIFVLLEWDSIENALHFAQSESLKEKMKTAGVVGIPSIYFLDEMTNSKS